MVLEGVISTVETRDRFKRNLARVGGLVKIFQGLRASSGRPSKSASLGKAEGDILRSAVIFLHATLEDLLRSGEELRFLQAPAKAFERVRWVPMGSGGEPVEKLKSTLTLQDLAEFRGDTVNDVLLRALQKRLEHSNYNNEQDVAGALERMGLDRTPFRASFPELRAMMTRRHWIAHRADVNKDHPHLTNPISVGEIEKWRAAVASFGDALCAWL